jgi:DNA-binding winged helix-turn-helix (wHTH) protein/tetratricopeptide (TPR) repeat protein
MQHDNFRLGRWIIDLDKGEIRDQQERREIAPLHCLLLRELAKQPETVLSRDYLLKSGWDDRPGADQALSRAISELRTLLDDSSATPAYIRTHPRRGYELITKPESIAKTRRFSQDRRGIALVVVLACCALLGGVIFKVWLDIAHAAARPLIAAGIEIQRVNPASESRLHQRLVAELSAAMTEWSRYRYIPAEKATRITGEQWTDERVYRLSVTWLEDDDWSRLIVTLANSHDAVFTNEIALANEMATQQLADIAQGISYQARHAIELDRRLSRTGMSIHDRTMAIQLRMRQIAMDFNRLHVDLEQAENLAQRHQDNVDVLAINAMAALLFHAGTAYVDGGNGALGKAAQLSEKALLIDDAHPLANAAMGAVLEERDPLMAMHHHDMAIRSSPYAADLLLSRANANLSAGRLWRAMQDVRAAHRLNPLAPLARSLMVEIHLAMGDPAAARRAQDQLLLFALKEQEWSGFVLALHERDREVLQETFNGWKPFAAAVDWDAIVAGLFEPGSRQAAIDAVQTYVDQFPQMENPYLPFVLFAELGNLDTAYSLVLDREWPLLNGILPAVWSRNRTLWREHPRFAELIHRLSMHELWQEIGPPDWCPAFRKGEWHCKE